MAAQPTIVGLVLRHVFATSSAAATLAVVSCAGFATVMLALTTAVRPHRGAA